MIKTLICSLPPLDQQRPPLGSAIVANICAHQGHKVVTVDLQYNLNQFLIERGISTEYFGDVFYEQTSSFSQDQKTLLTEFINIELDRLKVNEFNYIACSLFSSLAQPFGHIFFPLLRQQTSAKILIGGAGLTNFSSSLAPDSGLTFPVQLKVDGVIDEYITGEAEEALPRYFNVGHGPGIGNKDFVQVIDLDNQLGPDYSYYNLDHYCINDRKELTIIGSRGCVRDCTFCDVKRTSPKYKYRSGNNIANEIIRHYEHTGITNYYFADSLVNGSFKAFDDMCNSLAQYNFKEPISWSGQYIIRSRTTTPKNHFRMLKESGCSTLFVGIESGSDRIRFEMGKKFTNDDIEFYLENFAKQEIEMLFLMFTGYVSETEDDHNETLGMFKRWQKYVATGTIKGIETLNVLSILPGAPLEQYAKEHNFLFLKDDGGTINLRSWVDPTRPNFDFKERVRRHISMIEEAMKYKWPLWNGELSMVLYEQALSKFLSTPRKYIPISAI